MVLELESLLVVLSVLAGGGFVGSRVLVLGSSLREFVGRGSGLGLGKAVSLVDMAVANSRLLDNAVFSNELLDWLLNGLLRLGDIVEAGRVLGVSLLGNLNHFFSSLDLSDLESGLLKGCRLFLGRLFGNVFDDRLFLLNRLLFLSDGRGLLNVFNSSSNRLLLSFRMGIFNSLDFLGRFFSSLNLSFGLGFRLGLRFLLKLGLDLFSRNILNDLLGFGFSLGRSLGLGFRLNQKLLLGCWLLLVLNFRRSFGFGFRLNLRLGFRFGGGLFLCRRFLLWLFNSKILELVSQLGGSGVGNNLGGDSGSTSNSSSSCRRRDRSRLGHGRSGLGARRLRSRLASARGGLSGACSGSSTVDRWALDSPLHVLGANIGRSRGRLLRGSGRSKLVSGGRLAR